MSRVDVSRTLRVGTVSDHGVSITAISDRYGAMEPSIREQTTPARYLQTRDVSRCSLQLSFGLSLTSLSVLNIKG